MFTSYKCMINEDIYGQQYKNRWRDQVVMKKKTNVSSVLINQPKTKVMYSLSSIHVHRERLWLLLW